MIQSCHGKAAHAFRCCCQFPVIQYCGANDCMRTYKRTAVALDTILRFPYRKLCGNIAPFVCRTSGRRVTIRIRQESRYRQIVAPLVCDGLLDIEDEIRHFRTVWERSIVQGIGRDGCTGLPVLRNGNFIHLSKSSFDCLVIHLQDFTAVFSVAFFSGFFHPFSGIFRGEKPGYGKEGSLQDGADFAVQPDFFADADGINYIEADSVSGKVRLHRVRKVLIQFLHHQFYFFL